MQESRQKRSNSQAGRVLRFVYKQLYSNFAWAYDLVAAAVSFGEWTRWGRAVIPYLPVGVRLLEIGHGPGHLHLTLRQQSYPMVGIDLSPQMNLMAQRRLARAGLTNTLARANVFRLPFPDAAFGALISTFPTEFIFDPLVLAEAHRVLAPGGCLLVVPNAPLHPDGSAGVPGWFVRLLYRAGRLKTLVLPSLTDLFAQAGFNLNEYRVPTMRAEVMVWVCEKVEVIP